MLKTDYKDDILNTDVNVNRKFNIVRSNGTLVEQNVELRETTVFEQEGDSFGAKDINETNEAIVDVRGQIHTNLLNPTLETTTINGITCTNNGDGTFTLNGTATGTSGGNVWFNLFGAGNRPTLESLGAKVGHKYRFTCTPHGGSTTTYWSNVSVYKNNTLSESNNDIGNGQEIEIDADETNLQVGINIRVGTTINNVVYKPMLTEDLSATYDSFVKYSGSEERINEQVASLHESSKGVITNLLNYDFETTTKNGVTCTNNGNGTYTLTGTASAYTNFMILPYTQGEKVKKGQYKLVGCPKGGGAQKYNIWMCESSRGSDIDNLVEEYGDGVICNFEGAKSIHFEIRVFAGTTLPSGGLTFKPMLTTDLDATYNDYVPYSGDGRLNENVAALFDKVEKHETRLDSAETTIGNHTSTLATHTSEIAKKADSSDTMPKDAILFHYQRNIHTDNSGLFVLDGIQNYTPIACKMILPANSAQRHVEINYNPANGVYYGQTSANLDIEVTTIYVKFIP